jgi:hypothetical protein
LLAVTSNRRNPALPDVPTAAQAGLAGYNVASWNALAAPLGTPPAVIEALNKAAREAVARIIHAKSFWKVWDARLFHAREAAEKMGWASPASAALGLAMMATLRHGEDPARDDALWESITPTRDLYQWILDRLLYAVAAASLRDFEQIHLPRWVSAITGANADDAKRIAEGLMDMLEPLGVAARAWKQTLTVQFHVRSVRSLLRAQPSRPVTLKFAARPRHKDALPQRTMDLLGIPENDQHLGAGVGAGEVTGAGP